MDGFSSNLILIPINLFAYVHLVRMVLRREEKKRNFQILDKQFLAKPALKTHYMNK